MLIAAIDACVLFKSGPRDLLLRCAEAALFRPVWSAETLRELERNLLSQRQRAIQRAGADPDAFVQAELQVQRLCAAIHRAFPEALITDATLARFLPRAKNHPKDRHVLAAALAARVHVIVTDNIKDFPDAVLAVLNIESSTADAFLTGLLRASPDRVVAIVRQRADELKRPPTSIDQMLERLSRELPAFTDRLKTIVSSSVHDLPS